jgi:putative ABC transport system permease protein
MSVLQDVRFATRLLLKDRAFTLAAAMALALGIGVNAMVFTIVNAVLLRGLPFHDPNRIMVLWTENQPAHIARNGASFEDFQDWRDQSHSFSQLIAQNDANVNVSDNDQAAERTLGTYVSWNLFQMLGLQPILGRDFRADDDVKGATPVVMLGYGLWQKRYGGDPRIVGRTIRVNARVVTIIGVMPQGLQFPDNVDLWIPFVVLPPASFTGRDGRAFNVMGRLAPGVSVEQARAEIRTIGDRLDHDYPTTNRDWKPNLRSYDDDATQGPLRTVFLSMLGAVGFVLLIACANVANLQLARSVGRTREVSVRSALGATRWRIVRQLLAESVLLAMIGGVGGFLFAIAGVRWFDRATTDVGKPYWMTFTFDPVVFAYIGAICLAAGILAGLAPSLHVSKTDLNEVLKESGRSGMGGARASRWTATFVVSELILTLVLLSGAGFMVRSFLGSYTMNIGMDTAHLLTMRLYLPLTKYPQPGPRSDLYQQFEDRIAAIPGVQSSALATSAPLNGGAMRRVALDGRMPAQNEQSPTSLVVAVGDKYFETGHVPIRRGRPFRRDDGLPGKGAVIVNERWVAVNSPKTDPVGRQIRLIGDPEWTSIIGVVPDIRQQGFRTSLPDPVVYVPLRYQPDRTTVLFVKTTSDVAQITAAIRAEIRAAEPDIPVYSVMTMDALLDQQRWQYLVFGSMFALFAGIALALSAMGLYSVTAYSVIQRTQEVGVRMALGAEPRAIVWLILRRALIQLALGLPFGIAGSFGVGILLQSLLVGISPHDPLTLAAITLVLITVAVAAAAWPARRAARLDPMIALRYE